MGSLGYLSLCVTALTCVVVFIDGLNFCLNFYSAGLVLMLTDGGKMTTIFTNNHSVIAKGLSINYYIYIYMIRLYIYIYFTHYVHQSLDFSGFLTVFLSQLQ